jgi:hypothetical protein
MDLVITRFWISFAASQIRKCLDLATELLDLLAAWDSLHPEQLHGRPRNVVRQNPIACAPFLANRTTVLPSNECRHFVQSSEIDLAREPDISESLTGI